jgi:Asp-tRNA(Asn)/Glu-tRNA(Gln) amidotransferase A subunit family amidase
MIGMSLVEAARAIAAGEVTSQQLVEACLERIAEREAEVGAWVSLDRDLALAQARHRDNEKPRGPLHGVPIGVKDIIDTTDLPTACGSLLYRGHRPAADAACVALTRRAGAVILGKTVSTEFAFFPPSRTANPRDLAHTPGGSSSGSAAAVADNMVPMAFGTQTAGSVSRPASYCGVVGYKASFGQLPLAGVKPFSPSLDTLGTFTRTVADIVPVRAALLSTDAKQLERSDAPRLAVCRTPQDGRADACSLEAVAWAALGAERAGAKLREHVLPAMFATLPDDQSTIMSFEAARVYAYERDFRPGEINPAFKAYLDEAGKVTFEQYRSALDRIRPCRQHVEGIFAEADVIVAPAVFGEAPRGLAWSGDPLFNRIWTLLGLPTIVLPGFTGPSGLPVGVQLIGRIGEDEALIAAADWMEKALRYG